MLDYLKMTEKCTHGDPPACSAECPFSLDVRNFISRVQRGKIDSAYRAYRDATVFPDIVSRLCTRQCEQACERLETDEAIQLGLIERSVCALAKKKDPVKLAIPPKPWKIAVVGAGISGLACTLRLAERKYDVTLYEASETIGGTLRHLLDDEVVDTELNLQFNGRDYELVTGHSVETLEELESIEADAIYIATGKEGADFGLLDEAKSYSPLKVNGKYFFGGELIGADIDWAVRHGAEAANMMEMFLNTGNCLELIQPKKEIPNKPDPKLLAPTHAVKPASTVQSDEALFTKEELVEEAKRCIRCDCDICMTRCPLMIHYDKSPARIADNVRATVTVVDVLNNRIATRLIASCDQCGICREVCPHDVDLKTMIMDARQEMVEQGSMPPAFALFWLEDMEDAMSESASLVAGPPSMEGAGTGDGAASGNSAGAGSGTASGDERGGDVPSPSRCETAFFPGCQLGANDPRYVWMTYSRLLANDPGMGLMLTCCSAPGYWSGKTALHEQAVAKLQEQWESLGKPTLLCACPTCEQMLQTYLPGCEVESLYQGKILKAIASSSSLPQSASVFDPCTARFDIDAKAGVREYLQASGVELASRTGEDGDGQTSMCCGWGGQYVLANPSMASNEAVRASNYASAAAVGAATVDAASTGNAVVGASATDAATDAGGEAAGTGEAAGQQEKPVVVTYCANCRNTLFSKNGNTMHVLDAVLGINGPDRKTPTLTQRRFNRTVLKRKLLDDIWEGGAGSTGDGMAVDSAAGGATAGNASTGSIDSPAPDAETEVQTLQAAGLELVIDPEVAQTISDRWILETDIAQVIDHCEAHGQKVEDTADGSFFGHLKIGYMTYWVHYRREDQSWRVLDAYSHRMSIEESSQWIPQTPQEN